MHKGGLDNILFTPNGKLHRLLTKLAFENYLHPFQPFIIGQRIIGPKIAQNLIYLLSFMVKIKPNMEIELMKITTL